MRTTIFLLVALSFASCKKDDFTKDLSGSYMGYLEVDISTQHNGYDSVITQVSKLSNDRIAVTMTAHVVDTLYFTKQFEATVSEGGAVVIPPFTYLSSQGIELTMEGTGTISKEQFDFVATEDGIMLTTFTYSGSAQ